MGNIKSSVEVRATRKRSIPTPDSIKKGIVLEQTVIIPNNGLIFNKAYIPEEILVEILSYLNGKQLLTLSLVCHKWNELVKKPEVWRIKYERCYGKKAKRLPWYVFYCLFGTEYFTANLISNGNGKEKFKHWTIIPRDEENQWKVEKPPCGCKSIPTEVPELSDSCFSTSYQESKKFQIVPFNQLPVLKYVVNKFQPHIYVSEWFCGRFDCGCKYRLDVKLLDDMKKVIKEDSFKTQLEQWSNPEWKKAELTFKNYGPDISGVMFCHAGKDTQFWAGNYGSKMAGSVLRLVFDSIEPITD